MWRDHYYMLRLQALLLPILVYVLPFLEFSCYTLDKGCDIVTAAQQKKNRVGSIIFNEQREWKKKIIVGVYCNIYARVTKYYVTQNFVSFAGWSFVCLFVYFFSHFLSFYWCILTVSLAFIHICEQQTTLDTLLKLRRKQPDWLRISRVVCALHMGKGTNEIGMLSSGLGLLDYISPIFKQPVQLACVGNER